MPRIRVCTIMSGDTARGPTGVRRVIRSRERERARGEEDRSVSGLSSARWDIHSLSTEIVTPFHTPVHTHASQRINPALHPPGLIFNPLDSVNACGRPPPHDR